MLPIFIGSASSAVILSYYAKMISYAAFQLLSLVTLFYLSLGYPTRVSDNSDKLYSDLIAELRSQQVTAGTCAGAGHTSGCCVVGQTGCRVNTGNGRCYCDILCHLFRDCCSDITAIGCLPNTCFLAGLSRGCCRWSLGNSCFVPGGPCYCDRFCRIFNDCCPDVRPTLCPAITPPATTMPAPTTASTVPMTTPSPTTPALTTSAPTTVTSLSCVANGHMPGSGCCTGNAACFIDGGSIGSCFCDLSCYAEGTCCDDIQQLNCLPTNCAEAGKFNCEVDKTSAHQELCNVTTPQGQCYCDENCMAPGNPGDCCTDALPMVSPDDLFRISQMMRMKQLAQEMSVYRSRDMSDARIESPKRIYQAPVVDRTQDEIPLARPREWPYYGRMQDFTRLTRPREWPYGRMQDFTRPRERSYGYYSGRKR